MSTVLDAERYTRQLRGTVLFSGVGEEWIRGWLCRANVSISEYETGEYLFRKDDKSNRVCVLLRGTADVNRVSSDGLMHMSTLKKNDLFGAASLCGKDESFVTDIRCNEHARALIIPEEEMLNLLSENRTVLQNYLSYLNGRIRFGAYPDVSFCGIDRSRLSSKEFYKAFRIPLHQQGYTISCA